MQLDARMYRKVIRRLSSAGALVSESATQRPNSAGGFTDYADTYECGCIEAWGKYTNGPMSGNSYEHWELCPTHEAEAVRLIEELETAKEAAARSFQVVRYIGDALLRRKLSK